MGLRIRFGKVSKRLLLGLAALFVLAVILGFSLEWSRWRLLLVGRKLGGNLPELSWGELLHMAGPSSPYYLKPMFSEGRSLNACIDNPYNSEEDAKHGADTFRTRCAVCHGSDASGDKGPALNRPNYTHGNADWVVYKTIQLGIPGSAMPASGLGERDLWQVIAFLRARQAQVTGLARADAAAAIKVNVTHDDLLAAASRPAEWLTHSRTFDGWRYSRLDQITGANVAKLRLLWVRQLQTTDTVVEATPLVAGGAMFLSEPPSAALALDAKTGRVLWRTVHDVASKLTLCCGRVNRGMAMLGSKVFLGTIDAHLIAFDATDGTIRWDVKVADAADGYSITVAPLAIGDLVIVGISGGEFGIRGFLVAYAAETGKEVWRFHTVPGPGQPGHETWDRDSWKTGGGPTWVTGAYDPALDLVYWGVGNPSPVFAGDDRGGDNLYTNSVVALDRKTGKLAWHFQFSPHDEHDWDANQTPILADLTIGGAPRHAICWANRNGFYYVLDRATGEFLVGLPFVKQTWARGLDKQGRPIEAEGGRPTKAGTLVYPGIAGGTNWQSPAFNPDLGLVFIPATEGASVFTKSKPVKRQPGQLFVASGSAAEEILPAIKALDAATGEKRWEYRPPRARMVGGRSGLLATSGGLVFGASEGQLFALDARTGKELWRVELGGFTAAAPISFAVEDHQVIAVAAGRAVFMFGL